MNPIQTALPTRESVSLPLVRSIPALAVLLFGIVTLYCVGFSTLSVAHNATHDTRHASGFPRH